MDNSSLDKIIVRIKIISTKLDKNNSLMTLIGNQDEEKVVLDKKFLIKIQDTLKKTIQKLEG